MTNTNDFIDFTKLYSNEPQVRFTLPDEVQRKQPGRNQAADDAMKHSRTLGNAYSIDVENLDEVIARRDTIRLDDHQLSYKKRRIAVYNFLDHPRSAANFPYHVGCFIFVLISVILGAVSDEYPENSEFYLVSYTMEAILAVFFLAEFCVRIWSISADAKYMGKQGHFRYILRPVCLVDILIICVTCSMVFLDRAHHKGTFMDILRFVQILRLFHIDRQMSTWKMVKEMAIRSSFELVAAYYISALIFVALAYSVYEVEAYFDEKQKHANSTAEYSPTFEHYGDALWFSIVSFLTIGYGDIVPKHWISKVAVCILAYLAYCTFVAASTLVSVGMTLMMENENKDRQKSKIRNAAAALIQHWYRYHLTTRRQDKWNDIPYFKHVCFKLSQVDQRLRDARALADRLKEKYAKTQEKRSKFALRGAFSMDSRRSHGNPDAPMRPLSIKLQSSAATIKNISILQKSASIAAPNATNKSASTARAMFKMNGSRDINNSRELQREDSQTDEFSMAETDASSSFDLSDVEKEVEIQTMIANQKRQSVDINAIDETQLKRYRPLIRLFNFLLFRQYLKTFKRIRKPYQLIDAEAELVEMEHTRVQAFHELELKLEAMVGKAAHSPFAHEGAGKLTIERRLDICEEQLEKMDSQLNELMELAQAIGHAVGSVSGTPIDNHSSINNTSHKHSSHHADYNSTETHRRRTRSRLSVSASPKPYSREARSHSSYVQSDNQAERTLGNVLSVPKSSTTVMVQTPNPTLAVSVNEHNPRSTSVSIQQYFD